MGIFLVFIRKFTSLCGWCIEQEEPREPPKDGLKIILDNSLSSDLDGRRVLVSHLPSDISRCKARTENDGRDESPWSSAEEIKVEMHSESSLASSQRWLNAESASRPVKDKKKAPKSKRKIQGYCISHKILLVGEGNFSFSACLARAFGSATNMVATSLNSEVYLQCYYKDAMDNISELKRRGCKVLHDVDATTVANHCSLKGQSFDRIIFNFPHCGEFSLTKNARRKNRKLVRLFMENSSKMIQPDGEIHIRHKTSKSFSQWDLKGLASEAGLVLIEEAPVHFREFQGYETKYGFEGGKFNSDDNFDRYPCCNYKFALSEDQKVTRLQNSELNA